MYEDFVQAYESTVLAVVCYLGIPISDQLKVAPTAVAEQADDVTDEWVDRYHEQKRTTPAIRRPVKLAYSSRHAADGKRLAVPKPSRRPASLVSPRSFSTRPMKNNGSNNWRSGGMATMSKTSWRRGRHPTVPLAPRSCGTSSCISRPSSG